MKLIDELKQIALEREDLEYYQIKEKLIEVVKQGEWKLYIGYHINHYTEEKLEKEGLTVVLKTYDEEYYEDKITEISGW